MHPGKKLPPRTKQGLFRPLTTLNDDYAALLAKNNNDPVATQRELFTIAEKLCKNTDLHKVTKNIARNHLETLVESQKSDRSFVGQCRRMVDAFDNKTTTEKSLYDYLINFGNIQMQKLTLDEKELARMFEADKSKSSNTAATTTTATTTAAPAKK